MSNSPAENELNMADGIISFLLRVGYVHEPGINARILTPEETRGLRRTRDLIEWERLRWRNDRSGEGVRA